MNPQPSTRGIGTARGITALVITSLLVSACGSLAYHQVRDGETLYSLGWQYGYDYRTLARWNHLDPPYVIKPGQWLRIMPPPKGMDVVGTAENPPVPDGAAPQQGQRQAAPPPGNHRRRGAPARAIRWSWPAKGTLVTSFSAQDPMQKGLDIAGRLGEPVRAAASGRVVYSGNGLKGYGNLIIIKHNDHYLSAYGYNRRLFVKEGDQVAGGQEIAEMGMAGRNRVKLHFEIRHDGEPVDPLDYLPFGHSLQ